MKPVVVYRIEKWPMTERDMERLNVWRGILRKICEPMVEQGTWRIRTNQELHKLNQDSDVAKIKIGD
jgi:hypothetical protein